jgi:hypothetical protein
MNEREFWTALEFRVCREIVGLRDTSLRFLFCDGFVPDDHQPDDGMIVGKAFISEDGGRTFPGYRFRLIVPPSVPEGRRWEAILPSDEQHDWLTIDRNEKWIEVRLRTKDL